MKRDVLLTLVTKLALMLTGFLVSLLTARALGPQGRGEYYFAITLAGFVAQFGNLGLHASNTFYVARDPGHFRPMAANSLWIAFLVGGFLAALIGVGVVESGLFHEISPKTVWLALCLAPFSLYFLLGSNLLVGMGKVASYNTFEMVNRLSLLIMMGGAVFLGVDVDGFVLATLIAAIAGALLLWIRIDGMGGGFRFDMPIFRQGVNYGLRAYLAALLAFGVLRGNIFVVQSISGLDALGHVSIAAQLTDVLLVLPSSVALVLLPNLLRKNTVNSAAGVKRDVGRMLAVMAFVCLVVGFLAKPLIVLLYGKAFEQSASALVWMLPGVVFLSGTFVISQYIAAVGIPLRLIFIWLVALVFCLVSSVLLTLSYGINGAMMALSLTYGLVFFLMLRLAWFVYPNKTND